MQVMNKFEQQSSQKFQIDVKKLIEGFEIGKKSTQILRSLILQHNPSVKVEGFSKNLCDDHQDYYNALEYHSMVALDTFHKSISMLKSYDFDVGFVEKRKLDDFDVVSLDNPSNSNVSTNQESPKVSIRRESYKKRKIGCESREEVVTHLTDDGYAWRKYGQKMIHKSNHPRHYYRCTHKQEQKCQATKQIQQTSDNPTKYKLIYHGKHTCNNNIYKTSPYMIDSPEGHSSSIVLSFDGSNQTNPLLFPTLGSADTCNPSISHDDSTTEMTSVNHVSEQSEQISVGVAENYPCSTATSTNLEESCIDYSFIMAEFSDPMPDWWID